MNAIENGKRLIRAQVAQDLGDKLRELCKEHPELSHEAAWQELASREADLFKFASQVELDNWPTVPKPSVYRYTETGKNLSSKIGVLPALKSFVPQKVQAVEPDYIMIRAEDCDRLMAQTGSSDTPVLVYGSHEEQARQDAVLEIMKDHPGMLREVALQIAKDRDPGLFADTLRREEVEQNQKLILEEIARLRERDKKLSFSDAWSKVQDAHGDWFREFED